MKLSDATGHEEQPARRIRTISGAARMICTEDVALGSEARVPTSRGRHHSVNGPGHGHCPDVEWTITKAWLRKDSGSPSSGGPCLQMQRDSMHVAGGDTSILFCSQTRVTCCRIGAEAVMIRPAGDDFPHACYVEVFFQSILNGTAASRIRHRGQVSMG